MYRIYIFYKLTFNYMKTITSLLLTSAFIFGIGFMFNPQPAHAGYVNGYYRSNGTYVSGYYRSSPSSYSTSYKSYTPSYSSSYSTKSYPSYSSGLKYQSGYYKPSNGTYVQGHFKTYSDGNSWNNRKSLYGW